MIKKEVESKLVFEMGENKKLFNNTKLNMLILREYIRDIVTRQIKLFDLVKYAVEKDDKIKGYKLVYDAKNMFERRQDSKN